MSVGGWVCAVNLAPGLSFRFGLAAGRGRGVAAALGGCLVVVLGVFGFCVAA